MTNGEMATRILNLEKRVSELDKRMTVNEFAYVVTKKSNAEKSIVKMDLTLPEADIDGLHFNEQKVHAVFELEEDGWYYSRDILFLSARNVEGDNGKDILTEYLNGAAPLIPRIKQQIAAHFSAPVCNVEISLPTKNEGVKKYNGVDWWYWLKEPSSGSTAYFCDVNYTGYAGTSYASVVGGCAPMFCITEEA